MTTEPTNPLSDLENIYLGDFDRAFRRAAASSRAALDVIRILLVIARDIRQIALLRSDDGK